MRQECRTGVTLNLQVMKSFDEISTQADKVSKVMAQIAVASERQNKGIDEVNRALDEMKQLTRESTANSEESASAAEELASQAQEIRKAWFRPLPYPEKCQQGPHSDARKGLSYQRGSDLEPHFAEKMS